MSRQTMAPPSVADSLPSVNFGFDELRDRMAKFTARFDDFIEKGRKRVLEERNSFAVAVAELQGTRRHPSQKTPPTKPLAVLSRVCRNTRLTPAFSLEQRTSA